MLDFDSLNANDDFVDVGWSIVNDSLYSVTSNSHIRLLGKITLKSDTLIFYDEWNSRWRKCLIEKLNKDSLIVIIDGKRLMYHNKRLEYNQSLHFSKISLVLGKDIAPDLNMILDSTGLLEYSIPSKSIHQIIKLKPEKFLLIDSLFKYSCIDKLSTEKHYSCDDGWPKMMVFEYNNTVKKIYTDGITMPLRLNEIFNRMINEVEYKIY